MARMVERHMPVPERKQGAHTCRSLDVQVANLESVASSAIRSHLAVGAEFCFAMRWSAMPAPTVLRRKRLPSA